MTSENEQFVKAHKDELLQIITFLGGKATLNEIATAYSMKYKMPISLTPRFAFQEWLSDCPKVIYVNFITGNKKIVYVHL